MRVIHPLEMVHIDQQQCQRMGLAASILDAMLQRPHQSAAVEHAGERIPQRSAAASGFPPILHHAHEAQGQQQHHHHVQRCARPVPQQRLLHGRRLLWQTLARPALQIEHASQKHPQRHTQHAVPSAQAQSPHAPQLERQPAQLNGKHCVHGIEQHRRQLRPQRQAAKQQDSSRRQHEPAPIGVELAKLAQRHDEAAQHRTEQATDQQAAPPCRRWRQHLHSGQQAHQQHGQRHCPQALAPALAPQHDNRGNRRQGGHSHHQPHQRNTYQAPIHKPEQIIVVINKL
ncbi:hypothetical protein D3C72_904160 [compost metagenome]